jgi:exosortase A
MTSLARIRTAAVWQSRGWAGHLTILGAAIAVVLALFARDVMDMAHMWWNISTYGHCLFIVPISGWLIAQRWDEVSRFRPQGWWPGLTLIFGAAVLWMLGEAGGVGLFRHAAIVFMVQALVITILGFQVSRAILFPLFYLIFLIPVGEELVPMLQTVTAKLTIGLLGISSVPHQVDGVFITIPGGYFEVAEACSGVKFLIAMIAYGALVCNVCFRSWRRRAAFMAICVVVPILANGVRAFGTIYMAWVVDRDFAKGFDHIVYGWFFFAIVLAGLMAIGWRFFDRKVSDPWIPYLLPNGAGEEKRPLALALSGLAAIATPVAAQATIAASGRVEMPHAISLPDVRGWTRSVEAQAYPWAPHFAGADHRLFGRYRNADGDILDLGIAVFGWQEEGREIVGYGQGAIDPESHWAWAAETAKPVFGKAERIAAPGPVVREVVSVYVVDGKVTGSASEVKLATLKTRLMGGDQAAVAFVVSAEERPGRPARAAIDRFIAAMAPPEKIARALVATARGR